VILRSGTATRFQSAPPRGRRQSRNGFTASQTCFNPRLRVGGDSTRSGCSVRIACFNPRLRVGGDGASGFEELVRAVSIRASAWEATRSPPHTIQHVPVSIRASAWEATGQVAGAVQVLSRFNPRLRVGGDGLVADWLRRISNVSIRASAWEATRLPSNVRGRRAFQSAPPRGRRPVQMWYEIAEPMFQSAPPRGRRRQAGLSPPPNASPVSIRASAWEATRRCIHSPAVRLVSIRASAWEATRRDRAGDRGRRVSIRASAWEATSAMLPARGDTRFNPRLRVGGDATRSGRKTRPSVSIRASAWEATGASTRCSLQPRVSIRASAWEAT